MSVPIRLRVLFLEGTYNNEQRFSLEGRKKRTPEIGILYGSNGTVKAYISQESQNMFLLYQAPFLASILPFIQRLAPIMISWDCTQANMLLVKSHCVQVIALVTFALLSLLVPFWSVLQSRIVLSQLYLQTKTSRLINNPFMRKSMRYLLFMK